MSQTSPAEPPQDDPEMTVDDLARAAKVPVRTIREYQTVGILPPPHRRGRVGIYRGPHLRRLELIARLQDRGYSLAGIRDLLGAWTDGADLSEILGLEPDQLVHIDEPGAPATLDQLVHVLPALFPDHLDDAVAVGLVDRCGPDRYCVPSPSLLQLAVDSTAAGYGPGDILELLGTIHQATGAIAAAAIELLGRAPKDVDAKALGALAQRGRGLLAHGTGRATIYAIGKQLDVESHTDLSGAIAGLARTNR